LEIKVLTAVLEANDTIAEQNRELFRQHGNFVINLMGAPGAGKTSLLERTIQALSGELSIGVIEGDISTSLDAERISKKNVPVVQLNTHGACHLDANMIHNAIVHMDLKVLDLLIIENIGNLVCPAEFKVGEDHKVMLSSVPEGDDKPKKYPLMFKESKVLLLNKMDLMGHVDFNLERFKKGVYEVNPHIELFPISCREGAGLEPWMDWIRRRVRKKDAK